MSQDTPFTEDDTLIKPPSQPWRLYLGVALVGLIAFGLITWLLGLGPFAYRQILYGTSEVYILNLTNEEVTVQLDLGEPVAIVASGKHRTPILGGTTTLTTRNMAGEVLEEVDVFVDGTPVIYNVMGERCLVLSDVSSFYVTSRENTVEVLKTFPKGSRVVELPNDRVIWPRETLRDQVRRAEDGVSWVEIVACSIMEEEHMLVSTLNILLTERKKKQRELEIKRKMMMQGGSEAVEDYLKKKEDGATATAKPPEAVGNAPDAGAGGEGDAGDAAP